jgi:PEP-CTERM motif
MSRVPKLTLMVAAGALLALSATTAQAHLIYEGIVDMTGTGLGAVDTILTMQSHGSGTVESGIVRWGGTGSGDVIIGDPTVAQGVSTYGGYTGVGSTDMIGINHTITVGQTGWAPGSGLSIVFNPVEPGNTITHSITLNQMVLVINDGTTGALEFFAPWTDGPMTFLPLDQGTGQSGYSFALDAAETAQLNAVATLGVNDRIGLLAFVTDAQGGHDTFFATVVADPVPEPGSLVLLGSGLIGLCGVVGWRRRRDRNDLSGMAAA